MQATQSKAPAFLQHLIQAFEEVPVTTRHRAKKAPRIPDEVADALIAAHKAGKSYEGLFEKLPPEMRFKDARSMASYLSTYAKRQKAG